MKPLGDQTLYEILEVPFDATAGDIEAAYARAKAAYGPDSLVTYSLLSPEDAELLTSRLDEARSTLLDPGARAAYDELLTRPGGPPPSVPPPPRGEGAWATPAPVFAAVRLAPLPVDDDDEEADEAEREERVIPALAPEAPEPRPVAALAPASVPVVPAPEPRAVASVEPPPGPEAAPAPPPVRVVPIRLEREVPVAATVAPPAQTPAPAPPPAAVAAPTPAPRPVAAPPPPHRDLPIPDATVWTGEVLRQVRESRGITIQQISERTKVVRHHIENIEADRHGLLPAAVYLRGILLGIARELRLDGQKVARSYLEHLAAGADTSAQRR